MHFPGSHLDDEEEFLKIAASAESQSEHPAAKAVMAKAEGIALYSVSEFNSIAGIGVSCILEDGRAVTAGSGRILSEDDKEKYAEAAEKISPAEGMMERKE